MVAGVFGYVGAKGPGISAEPRAQMVQAFAANGTIGTLSKDRRHDTVQELLSTHVVVA